ncbi:unnamed protein product [marine sediment metagenome]|uniref:Uncharacterized protein n=1 Tax=marine sediment metagenome TaxID=412755 RepID=X1S0N8_9ZZZZ
MLRTEVNIGRNLGRQRAGSELIESVQFSGSDDRLVGSQNDIRLSLCHQLELSHPYIGRLNLIGAACIVRVNDLDIMDSQNRFSECINEGTEVN